jgi:hypothetical protein
MGQFLSNQSNQLVKSSNSTYKLLVKNNILINTYTEDPTKFRPNDELYYKHDFYTMLISNANKDRKKIKQLEKDKINILQDIERLKKSNTENDIFINQTISLLEIDIPKIDLEIEKCNKNWQKAQSIDHSVLNEWKKYEESLINLIRENNFIDFVKPENLYTTPNLYSFITTQIRILVNSHQELETFYEKMNKLSVVFDLGYIQNTRLKISADYNQKIKMSDNLQKLENSISLPIENQLIGIEYNNNYMFIED